MKNALANKLFNEFTTAIMKTIYMTVLENSNREVYGENFDNYINIKVSINHVTNIIRVTQRWNS